MDSRRDCGIYEAGWMDGEREGGWKGGSGTARGRERGRVSEIEGRGRKCAARVLSEPEVDREGRGERADVVPVAGRDEEHIA
eukprot:583899-Rhodomonas_salina.3